MEKALQENKSVYNTELSLDEVITFLFETGGKEKGAENKKNDEKWRGIVKRAAELLLLLRVLPLLNSETKKLTDQLKKMDKNDPIPCFLEAKIQISDPSQLQAFLDQEEKSLKEIWNCDYFNIVRQSMINKQLKDVCSKCNPWSFSKNKEIRNELKNMIS